MAFPRPLILLSTAALAWLGAITSVSGVIITFQESASYTTAITQIRNDQTTNNFGLDPRLIVGRTVAPATIRGLLNFSLAAIPAGSTINSVTLTLVSANSDVNSFNGAATLNLHSLSGAFVEGSGTAAGVASTTAATWLRRSTAAWTTAGGDYSSTIMSSISVNPFTTASGASYVFGSGTDFVAAAQAGLDGGTGLNLLLKLNDTQEALDTRRAFFFQSDESTTASQRPLLTIDYTPVPESGVAMLGLLTGGVMLAVRRRRGC